MLLKARFFDTMTMENAASMSALLQTVTSRHMMFGSDYPYPAYRGSASEAIASLASSGVLNPADLAAISEPHSSGVVASLEQMIATIADKRAEGVAGSEGRLSNLVD